MTSRNANATPRKPQRQRGRERVETLLQAAADCFVEKGYADSTMTEIAARAGASIGSLYQFFPTKELLAQALLTKQADDLHARLAKVSAQAPGWNTGQLATVLIGLLVAFRRRHPSFVTLIESPSVPTGYSSAIRRRMRTELQAILTHHVRALPADELQAAAVVVQQMMKAAVTVNAEPALPGRKAVLGQLEMALQLYLRALSTR